MKTYGRKNRLMILTTKEKMETYGRKNRLMILTTKEKEKPSIDLDPTLWMVSGLDRGDLIESSCYSPILYFIDSTLIQI